MVIRNSDYKNHRRFILSCISKELIPVSGRLKSTSNSRSSKAKEIIHRAEKQLLQDRIRCINGILCDNGVRLVRCRSRLLPIVMTTTTMDRCTEFINKVRESKFINVRDRQVNKFSRLAGKSDWCRGANAQSIGNNNQLQASSNNNNKWVINISNTPCTQAQESLLSKGPYYAIAPKNAPNLEYITAIEIACQKLNNQDAEELRADINGLLKKLHGPRPNLTKEECKALVELKRDKERVILTVDKGVAMVGFLTKMIT